MQKKSDRGFTIIEIMIVLAIAGLILLIVFLAVPALQRNSRNTQRKNDVATVLGAVAEYSANQNGALPAVISRDGAKNTISVAGNTCSSPTNAVSVSVSGQFSQVNGSGTCKALEDYSSQTGSESNLQLLTKARCEGNDPKSDSSARKFIALYAVESNVQQCQAG